MFIIYTCSDREFRYVSFSMIHNRMYIWRKNRLRIIVYRYCRICPPKKSLSHWRTVIKLSTNLNIRFIRIQSETCNSFCSIHLIHVIDHNCFASVFMFSNCIVYRKICSRTMVLWPVKFDTTGNPWSCQTNQCRFNYMIVVYKIISICFIICSLNSAAKFRKNHHFNILIFQINSFPCFILFDIFYFFNNRIWIYPSGTSLIYSFFRKNRILFCCTDLISRDDYFLFPDSYFFHVTYLPIYIPVYQFVCTLAFSQLRKYKSLI